MDLKGLANNRLAVGVLQDGGGRGDVHPKGGLFNLGVLGTVKAARFNRCFGSDGLPDGGEFVCVVG